MKNKILLIIIFFFATVRAFAANGAPEADTFLWRISKANQPTSYLVGTMHIAPKNTPLPPNVQAALSRSQQLVMESHKDENNVAEIISAMRLMTSSKTLSETLGAERVKKLHALVAQSAVRETLPLFDAKAYTAPWAVWYFSEFALMPSSFSLESGIDSQLENAAMEQKIPIFGLETTEPMVMLRTISNDVIIRSIDMRLKNVNNARLEAEKSWQWYKNNQMRKMWAHDTSSAAFRYSAAPQDVAYLKHFLADQLLRQRNENWLPKLTQMLPEKPTLVAVGALHLFGEHGLIVLLRKQGYTVTPILPTQKLPMN
ncbi:TraB/GumN family protein [Wielerella bovis]|uniref:TraB/GumN family protein n=1 Tax=Wielerella bovis TaxID=2917790 RepID=UPI0020196D7C|nr:TraB/GumN family protein [Wielerella bovis]MCG7656291.1 TraB/GumN family protein [Wielerella bovis]MCG7658516.1 TraB/GumN family protein [Wielerella bovis]